MKPLYIIIISLLIILLNFYVIHSCVYKSHRNISSENVDYELQSLELNQIMVNSNTASQYIDKVIQTSGIITSIEQNSILLDDKVQVNFINENINNLKEKDITIIKGRCVGYDDLLELVKIDQATIIKY